MKSTHSARMLALGVFLATTTALVAVPTASWAANGQQSSSDEVLMQADELTYDQDRALVIASGNVEVFWGERILYADQVSYDQRSGVVTADGNIRILEEDGTVLFAKHIELKDGFRNGVIESIQLLLSDDSRLAGNYARRTGDNVTRLEKAVYSPCEVCAEEGKRTPLWQIKAFRVTHDQEAKTIAYEDAFLELAGVPVFYVPYFSHADPSVKRKSGFLSPRWGSSSELGFTAEIPYFWAINPSTDLTLAPFFADAAGEGLKTGFRKRFAAGLIDVDASGTITPKLDDAGNETSGDEFRGHFFGKGRFVAENNWRWGFDAEITSDDTYLRRYDISNESRLTSNLFAEQLSGRDYFAANAYWFQGLRRRDDDNTTPFIPALIDYNLVEEDPWLGGRFAIDLNSLILERNEGADSRRVSASADWRRSFYTRSGQVLTPFASLRGDVYFTDNVTNPNVPGATFDSETTARMLPAAGIEWSWPFAGPLGSYTQVIEPVAQVVFAPNHDNPDEIPNEDSVDFEFDATNLFQVNKFPGLDRWEGGHRANVGVRWSLYGDNGGSASVMLGQSFRYKENDAFSDESGLRDQASDFVGEISLNPASYLNLTHRFRVDRESLDFDRNEISLNSVVRPFNLGISYTSLAADTTEKDLPKREEIDIRGGVDLSNYWRFTAGTRHDLELDTTINNFAGIQYKDECLQFNLIYKERFTRDRDVEPEQSINFQIILTNLS